MILRRIGSKAKLADQIQKYFPPHKIYIEVFFGAGGMFFNKPKVRFNTVNDLDSEVYNLYMVLQDRKEELERAFMVAPVHIDLLKHWHQNKEVDPVKKSVRFLFLSNLLLNGRGTSLRSNCLENPKAKVLEHIEETFLFMHDVKFFNKDFREFIDLLYFREGTDEKEKAFIYADPPYLGTVDNYEGEPFKEQDYSDLLDSLQAKGVRFAVSEFNSPFVLAEAERRGLKLVTIGERNNIKNRRVEVLTMNYDPVLTLF